MRNIIKYLVGIIYKSLLEKYPAKTRHYKYKGINLIIPHEVFHPNLLEKDFIYKIQLKRN
jgi:hypothetical protein